jgi:hypothetical protein
MEMTQIWLCATVIFTAHLPALSRPVDRGIELGRRRGRVLDVDQDGAASNSSNRCVYESPPLSTVLASRDVSQGTFVPTAGTVEGGKTAVLYIHGRTSASRKGSVVEAG